MLMYANSCVVVGIVNELHCELYGSLMRPHSVEGLMYKEEL